MAITPKCLVEPVVLTTVNLTYYTASKGVTIIDKMTVLNMSANYQTLIVYLIPSGVSPSGNHIIIKNLIIAPSETYDLTKVSGHVLNTGDSIQALAGAASVLSFRVSGREVMI